MDLHRDYEIFILEYIPFPGLPKLLLSAIDLVHFELYGIPHSGYISPDAIVACLSTLTRLELLKLCFKSPRPLLKRKDDRTYSPTRTLLPSLADFTFSGVSEYLEAIVDWIDASLLDTVKIRFFHQPIFDTTRLAHFISRLPKFKTCNEANIRLSSQHASVTVLSISKTTVNASLLLEDWVGQSGFPLLPWYSYVPHPFKLSPLQWKVLPSPEEISPGTLGQMAPLAYGGNFYNHSLL